MKKKEKIALEAITQHVHTIHMDWMSNLVAGLFNYKIVDVKETEEKNMCSIELCIAKIYYFSQKNSRKTNSGRHVVYVVNSFHPDMINSIIYTRDQQHEHQLIAFKSVAGGNTICSF